MPENLSEYEYGAHDERSWGTWEVISEPVKDNGIVTRCEKRITVYPKQMLSLQYHDNRGEVWTVKNGILTVCYNDKILTLDQGDSLSLPQGTLHAMVNLTDQAIVVHEVQSGQCREDDNYRLMDFGNRPTVDTDNPDLTAARNNYKTLMEQITCA